MKIGMLGDIALIGNYDMSKHSDVKEKLKFLKAELDKCDYRIANLEAPFTTKKNTMICKSMHLKSAKENVEVLKYLGIDAVCLANNHIYDYGRKGLEETIVLLEENGIRYFGVDGKDLLVNRNGEKITLSGFCCYSTNGACYKEKRKERGVNLLTFDNINKQIKHDKEWGAFSIINLHYGLEHIYYPATEHIKLIDWMMEQNHMIVQGHHSHIVQGIKKTDNAVAFYSLGNAIFDNCTSINGKFEVKLNEQNKQSIFACVEVIDGNIKTYDVIGYYNNPSRGISPFDMKKIIEHISNVTNSIENYEQYEKKRKSLYQEATQNKFGKKDLHWLLSRMNYYAIGAKIKTKIYHKRYIKEVLKIDTESMR